MAECPTYEIYLIIAAQRTYSRYRGHVRVFRGTFYGGKKGYLLAPRKQMSFLIITTENVLFQHSANRLRATVLPNKSLPCKVFLNIFT